MIRGGGVMNISHGMVNTLLGTTTAKAHAPIILEESEDDSEPMGCAKQTDSHN